VSRRALNVVLLLAVAGVVAANLLLTADHDRRNFELFPDMARSPRADAFEPSLVFGDGATLQPPPAGTIPRGLPPLPFAAGPAEAARAGRELASPVPPGDAEAERRGGQVFATFCQPCHGAGGRGDGPVSRRGFPPPPSLLAERALALADGQLFHAITFGQGNMPGYAGQIGREDRWKAVSYIRWLQRQSGRSPS